MELTKIASGARRGYGIRGAWIALSCLAVASAAGAQGTPYLVRDIGQGPGNGGVAVRSTGAVGERVFFAGNDGEHGFELWTSDGSEDGTRLVRDIQPGPRGAVITDFTAVGGAMFFVVDDGVHGRELWTSDGTEAGTHLVRDVAPGRLESLPHLLTPFGDLLLFVADDGAHGDELWVSDGTDAGTAMVADVRAGAGGARIKELVVAGGRVWFVANDGVHGSEPWSSDGTPQGTLLVGDLRPGADGAQPAELVGFGDGVLFAASDGATGSELWSADATSGARRVADLMPGRGGSNPSGLVAAGDLVYFTATTSAVDGAQLWATDGSEAGTYRVSPIRGQWSPGLALELTAVIGDTLYFVTRTDDGRGATLWRSDGTEDGTQLVKDLKSYPCSDEFRAMVVFGDRLMLVARSGDSDDELWISDGTDAGTRRVKDIFPGQRGGRPGSLAVAGDVLFFAALDGLHGRELWKSDGTEDGTVLVRDILLGVSGDGVETYPPPVALDDQVLVHSPGPAIWTSDGTSAGTTPLALPAGLAAARLYATSAGAIVGVTEQGRSSGRAGLWHYDGTSLEQIAGPAADPYRVDTVTAYGDGFSYTVINRFGSGGSVFQTIPGTTTPQLLASFARYWPTWPVRVRGKLYFSAGDGPTGSELWKTDGTPQGTTLVADINPGSASAVFNNGIVGNVGRRILVGADDGVHGNELYVTDGTAAGTRLLRDIQPGPAPSWPGLGGRLGGVVYFGAADGGGVELWRSNGTESGTFRVKDIVPGPGSSGPSGFARLGDVLLFSAYQPATGRALWRTDGTDDGTWLVANLQPGNNEGGGVPMVVVGDVAYLAVTMPNRAVQLWVTDGTPAGTRIAADVSGGAPGAGVRSMENRNGQLYFVASDAVHGNELWALTCGDGVIDELEACDDGAQNGSAAGCCTGACELRPGAGDECDPIEGSLVVRRARVQYDVPGGGATGRIATDGRLDADANLPLSLAAGLTAFVEDGAGFARRIEWRPEECVTRPGGVLRCARAGAVAVFRPVSGAAPGAQRHRFSLTVTGLDVAGPLAPSLTVKLRTGDRLDRAGDIEDCVARRGALVCRP